MICTDEKTSVENNCVLKSSETGSLNMAIIGGAGGGGLLLIVLIAFIVARFRKVKNKSTVEVDEPELAEQSDPEQENLYSRINDRVDQHQDLNPPDPVYSTPSTVYKRGKEKVYSQIELPGTSDQPQQLSLRSDNQGDTYAEVTFVTNRRGKEKAVYGNQGRDEEERQEITYATVTDVREQTFQSSS